MDNYYYGSKLYTYKKINDNGYLIYVLLSNNYTHPLSLSGMVNYSNQTYDIIAGVLNNYKVTIICKNEFNYCEFSNKESAETCIVTLNMLRATGGK
jgi:hypothetical protein